MAADWAEVVDRPTTRVADKAAVDTEELGSCIAEAAVVPSLVKPEESS